MSKPTNFMSLPESKLDGKSVFIDMPMISTAWSSRPCERTNSSLARIAAAPAVGGRAALQLRQRLVHHRRRQDLVERVDVAELRVRVVRRVAVVLLRDAGEALGLHAVALHVLAARVAEHLRRGRRLREAALLVHRLERALHRHGAVHVLDAERALLHLLEAERERAVGEAALDEALREVQRATSRSRSCC